ncbi:acyltransferase domain-containing protein [Nonomuraea sp. MCN248]|uniref:Acyltransferase domain-containing protein n=1 Tax=Nonomuraea corallina TaxID=2989783 RepID=A0ABT4S4S7_9ACTN|nr:acyltransferase domain-containing protein [Nonomuraea corallina]MDA0632213.1 acyltransferase domain-containing protein [Nonomuraea corallina]
MANALDLLRADPRTAAWLTGMESDDAPDVELVPPDALTLLDLAVPHEDVNEILALTGPILDDPGLRWLLERCARRLVRDLGAAGISFDLPHLPAELGAAGRYFHLYAFVAALPHVRAYHREHGVPADVSRHTLADLGRNLAVHRRRHGVGGVIQPSWIQLHFRGVLYQLGRLQFERAVLGSRMGAVVAGALPAGPGSPCLLLHIPDFSGPLTPAACDDSLARARAFFPRHFPGEHYAVAACFSWLLDPQLADHLPDTANIVAFQRRFRPGYRNEEPNDAGPIEFVFGDPALTVDELSPRTTLEHAVVAHLRAGGHWYDGNGWFPL